MFCLFRPRSVGCNWILQKRRVTPGGAAPPLTPLIHFRASSRVQTKVGRTQCFGDAPFAAHIQNCKGEGMGQLIFATLMRNAVSRGRSTFTRSVSCGTQTMGPEKWHILCGPAFVMDVLVCNAGDEERSPIITHWRCWCLVPPCMF